MLKRLKQILRDHKAMNLVRAGNGDVQLVQVVGANNGFDCYLFQRDRYNFNKCPAEAIISGFDEYKHEKGIS